MGEIRWATMELPTDADEEVASWIAEGKPPIFFGFGSIRVESPADTGVGVLRRDGLQPRPGLPRVVHHGGVGTTAIGLRAGGSRVDPFDTPRSDDLGSSGQTT
jgi:hypothetical protein